MDKTEINTKKHVLSSAKFDITNKVMSHIEYINTIRLAKT